MEYLCPICRRLSNSILPAAGPGSAEICPPTASRQNSLQRWCTSVLDNLPSSRGAGCHKAWLHALQGSLPPDVPRGMGLADPRHAEHVRKGTWQERLGSRGAMTSKFLKCCWFAVYRKAKLEVYEHSRRVQKIRARNRRAAGGRLQGDAFHADHGEGGVEDGLHNEDDRGAAGDNVEAVGEEWSAQTLETAHRHRQELSNVPPSAVAWALLAHNLAHWEVLQRPTVERGNPGPTPSTSSDNCSNHDPMVRAAYWRSLRGIAAVCAAAGTEISKWEEPDPGTAPSTPLMTKKRLLCALVEWVAGGPDASLDPCASSAPVGILRALLRELQEVKGMSPHQPLPDQPTLGDMLRDPFLVLLELLAMAAELTTALEDSLKWVLPVVYVMAAAQAAVASVSSYHHQVQSLVIRRP